jgi:phage terminase large subunit-like protein
MLENIPDDQLDAILEALESLAKKSPLDYVPHPANSKTGFGGMKLFHTSPARVRLIFGGNQSGKTVSGANELLFHATGLYPEWYPQDQRINHPIKARIIGEDYTKWGKVLESKLLEWLPVELIVHKSRTLKGALEALQIRHVSGGTSYIDVMTHEQDDGVFESWTGDFAWFDEPPPQAKYVATVRGLMAQQGRAIFTMTPLKEPWLHDRFILDKDKDEIENNSEVFYLSVWDNPVLTDKDREWFLSQVPEDEREAREFGKSKHLAGRVYKEFDEAVHVVSNTKVKIDEKWPVYFVLDPHDRKPHYGIWARINPMGTLFIVDCIKLKGTIREFAAEVFKREKVNHIKSSEVIRIGDPNKMNTPSAMNGLTFVQEFSKYGLYFVVNVNDDVALGHLSVAGKLMWDKTRPISSTNCPKLFFVKETCSLVIKEMLTYVWDEYKGSTRDSKGVKESPKDINKDFPDTIRYLIMFNPSWYDANEKDPVFERSSRTGY